MGPGARIIAFIPRAKLQRYDPSRRTREIRNARTMTREHLSPPPWPEHDGMLRSPWMLAESSAATVAHSSEGANEARRGGTGGESRKDVK